MENNSEKRFPTNPNDYKLYEEIGEGVSATVHRALCVPLNEIVAIKVLDLEKCNNDLDGIKREVQTMSLINHPNVVRAFCSFTAGHNLWVVMPYMAGGSALHLMKSAFPNGFEEPIIATLLREVLKALVYLHGEGHIHRDVKAGNILIDAKGTVKLADFGVSACMFDAGDRQRSRNTFVGTPCWMAPEVMHQTDGYDFKADIWSFGITALELARGHAPFYNQPPVKVLLMILQNAPPGFDLQSDKKFSKSFKSMVTTCLVKDPKKRPTSEELLKHSFFKHARSKDYIVHALLDDLSPLGDQYRMLKVKDGNISVQDIDLTEQLSQREYIQGISGWDFNLEDLKAQAALIDPYDSDYHLDRIDSSRSSIMESEEGFDSSLHYQSERVNIASTATAGEEGSQDLHELGSPSTSTFPTRPLGASKSHFDIPEKGMQAKSPTPENHTASKSPQQSLYSHTQIGNYNGETLERSTSEPIYAEDFGPQKFSSDSLLSDHIVSPFLNFPGKSERNNFGQGLHKEINRTGSFSLSQMRDSLDISSATDLGEPPDATVVQRRGRFHITSANAAHMVAPSANITVNSVASTPTKTGSSAIPLLPSLQFLLHGNATQMEQLVKLMRFVEQKSGASPSYHKEISSVNSMTLASPIDKELRTYVTHLQQQIVKLGEEVQWLKQKNSQMEQQILALGRKEKNIEDDAERT